MKRSIVLSVAVMSTLAALGTASSTIWHIHPDSAVSSIQAGIDPSSDGDTVLVYPAIYVENVNFNGKNIVLGSLLLTTGDTSYISSTIIDGDSSGSVVTFENGEDSTALVTGFTIQNGLAERGGGIHHCSSSSPSMVDLTIGGNTAEYGNGGGISCRSNSRPSFDPANRCNILLNNSAGLDLGYDLYASNCPATDVVADTFTVLRPDDYFAYRIDNFAFDILHAKTEQVNQDLCVSPDGSDDNTGLTVDQPLLTVSCALAKILADSTNPLTIHLSNGTYFPSETGERFPLNCRSYVSLFGENEASTILDGEGLSRVSLCRELVLDPIDSL